MQDKAEKNRKLEELQKIMTTLNNAKLWKYLKTDNGEYFKHIRWI